MSLQAISQVLETSRARGTKKLVLILLANRVNLETGLCFPSIRLIAHEAGVSTRQVQNILRQLVADGELIVHYRTGHSSLFSLPPTPGEAPNETSTPTKQVSPLKPTSPPPEVHFTPTPEVHFTLNQNFKQKINGSDKVASPPTSKHPAIIAYREAIGRFPPKAVWPKVVDTLGDQPDVPRLRETFSEWCGCGYNPQNITGILSWYSNGIPPRASNGKGRTRTLIDPNGNSVVVTL